MKKNNTVFIVGMLLVCLITAVITYFSLSVFGVIDKDKIDLNFTVKPKNDTIVEYSNENVNIDNFTVSLAGSLLEGHKSNVNVKTEAKDLGIHTIDFNVSIYNEKGIEVSDMYNITINSCQIEIVQRGIEVVIYKEKEGRLEPGDYEITSENKLLDGHFIGYNSRISKYYIVDHFSTDVTKYYDIKYEYQISNVLEITLDKVEKVYDGKDAEIGYKITRGELMNDSHKLHIDYFINGTLVDDNYDLSSSGKLNYTASASITDKDGKDISKKYVVNIIDSTINILKRDVSVLVDSLEKVYDDKKIELRDLDVTEENLLVNHKAIIKFNNSEQELINVGSNLIKYDVEIVDYSGKNLTENYNIKKSEDSYIVITKKEASLEVEDFIKTYDSLKVDLNNLKVLTNNFILGHKVEIKPNITNESSLVNANNTNVNYDISVFNRNGNDVTNNYNISSQKYFKLVINKRYLDIDIPNFEKEYDGQSLVINMDLVKYDNLALNDQISLSLTNSFEDTNVTDMPIKIDKNNLIVNISRNGISANNNYIININEGSYSILKRKVAINLLNNKFEYNNSNLVLTSDNFEKTNLLVNHYINQIVLPYVEVGTYTLDKSKIEIFDNNYNNVSNNYDIYLSNNNIEITKINLNVRLDFNNQNITYTGENIDCIKNDNIIISKNGTIIDSTLKEQILNNINIKYKYLKDSSLVDNVIDVGSYKASILNIEIISSDIKNNYSFEFTKDAVSFNVSKADLAIQPQDIRKVYDNKAIEKDDFVLVPYNLPTGFRLEVTNKLEIFDVRSDYDFSEKLNILVYDKTNKNVTENFNITVNKAYLTISPRQVSIDFNNVEKVYDGNIINTSLKITNVINLVNGDYIRADLKTISSDAKIYDIKNSFDVNLSIMIYNSSSQDVSKNYEINYSNFEIKITKRSIDIVMPNINCVYNKEETIINGESVSNLVGTHKISYQYNLVDLTNVQNSVLVPSLITIRNNMEEDVTLNYDIKVTAGSLVITPKIVNVIFNTKISNKKEFNNENQFLDNNILEVDDIDIRITDLVCEFEYRQDGFVVNEVKNAALYKVMIKNILYNNKNYEFIYNDIYDLNITPKQLKVSLEPKYSRVYEGKNINLGESIDLNKDNTLGSDKFNLIFALTTEGKTEIKNVGKYNLKVVDFLMTSGLKSNYYLDLKEEVVTTLEITQKFLNFESQYQTVEYDGKFHSTIYPILLDSLVGNDRLDLYAETVKNVNVYRVDCFEYISNIVDESGNYVSDNYSSNSDATGTLVITKREVTIYTESGNIDSSNLKTTFDTIYIENGIDNDFVDIKKYLTFIDFSNYSNGVYQNLVIYNYEEINTKYNNYKIKFEYGTVLINK